MSRSSGLRGLLAGNSANGMVLYNLLSQFIVAAINFITVPIFTHLLSISNYGVITLFSTWALTLQAFIGLKLEGSLGTAYANLDKDKHNKFQASAYLLEIAAFVIFMGIALPFLVPLSHFSGLSSGAVIFCFIYAFAANTFSFISVRNTFNKWARRNFFLSIAILLSTSALSVILILFWPHTQTNYFGWIIGMTLPNLVIGGFFAIKLVVQNWHGFSFKYWQFALPLTIPLIFHQLSHLVLSQTGKVVVQKYYGLSEVGIYGLAITIGNVLLAIWTACNNAYVPFYYDDLKSKDIARTKKRFINYAFLFTGITVAAMMVSPEIVSLLSTSAYAGSIGLMPMVFLGQYFMFLYSFPVNFEFYIKKTKSIAIGTFLAALVNLGLNLLLVPHYGIFGSALATTIAYFGLFLFHWAMATFIYKDRTFSIYSYLLLTVISTGACLITYALTDFALIRWIITIAIAVVLLTRIIRTKQIF